MATPAMVRRPTRASESGRMPRPEVPDVARPLQIGGRSGFGGVDHPGRRRIPGDGWAVRRVSDNR